MKYLPFLLIPIFTLKTCAQKTPVNFVDSVLTKLQIERTDCLTDLIIEQNTSEAETIVVIPEIADEDAGLIILNSHILVVDPTNGNIKSRFSEKESWYSDALRLEQITVTQQPFDIGKDTETIGIIIDYSGTSAVNPYHTKQLSLFVRAKDTLHRVLKDYTVYSFGGETNGRGSGEFTQHSKTIVPSGMSNGTYYALNVTDSITKTRTIEGKEDIMDTSVQTEKLTYKDGIYTN